MKYRFLYHIFFILLLSSCAQVVSPGGGPKDKTPPTVLKYTPDSASLFFKTKSIEIVFDEYIQLIDLNNQLIISPPLDKSPDIKVSNKTLIIRLNKNEVLKPNTTYCFNFGNAVRDINESNPKENFKYIFSTGSFIDSLTVNGQVENAFDHITEKGLLVMLYSDFSDSVIYKKQPDYFAKTLENGTFQINNIREGKYKMLALKDANGNYKYDGENESVGFIDSSLDVLVKQKIRIELFQEPAQKLFIKKHFQHSFGRIVLIFNKPTDSLKVNAINHTFNENEVILDYSKKKDSLTYWFKNFEDDTLKLQVANGVKVLDTLEFKIAKKENAIKNNRNPLQFYLLKSPNANFNFDLNSDLHFVFNNPIDTIKAGAIELKEDTLNVKNFEKLAYEKSAIPNNIKITPTPKLKENTTYRLMIPPGTFTDIFGLKNDTLKIDFKTREEKYYGTVKLNINFPAPNDSIKKTYSTLIVQLIDEKENVIRENSIKKNETIHYDYIYPQKYKLKVIVDDNSNGKWDTGNLLQKIQPENVIYFSEQINIRSNWDSDLEWNVKE